MPETASQELKFASAGPLATLVISLMSITISAAIASFLPQNDFWIITSKTILTLAQINVIWFVFNLIPAFPLDGGRIFRSLFWLFSKNAITATKTAFWLSVIMSIGLFALGIFLINPIMCFVSVVIVFFGYMEMKQCIAKENSRALTDLTVEDIMNHITPYEIPDQRTDLFKSIFVTCEKHEPAIDVMERLKAKNQRSAFVMEDDEIIGHFHDICFEYFLKYGELPK